MSGAGDNEIDQVALRPLRGGLDRIDVRESSHALEGGTTPFANVANDLRPSRWYQILLVLAGFLMTFHVIGINSIYGLFQVCFYVNMRICTGRTLPFFPTGVLYIIRD